MALWVGTATYFNNCPAASGGGHGAGACGTCFRDEGGIAYPNVTGHPPDYSSSCTSYYGGITPEPCGQYLNLVNYCVYGEDVAAPIVDHGPGAACTLDTISYACTGANYAYRLLDLTPLTYSDIGGDLQAGHTLIWWQDP